MNTPLRALLVDDERPARRWLRELLAAHPEIVIAGEADGVKSAFALAAVEAPDLVFLDVQMPPGSGFDLLPCLPPGCRVVFVTAHDTFAVKAFEANALDYLLKPVHPDRLCETVRRLLAPQPSLPPAQDASDLRLQDFVPLRDRDRFQMTRVEHIAAIQAEGAYVRIQARDQPPILVLGGIGEWEKRLPCPPFARLDRSLLINLNRIKEARVRSRDETLLTLHDLSTPLQLGRAASLRLRKYMKASQIRSELTLKTCDD